MLEFSPHFAHITHFPCACLLLQVTFNLEGCCNIAAAFPEESMLIDSSCESKALSIKSCFQVLFLSLLLVLRETTGSEST